jgi:hypothetical protein
MSGADQRAVVAVLRGPLPLSSDRWTAWLVARAANLGKADADAAIRSLRNAGKIKFGALELSPSMLVERSAPDAGQGGDPLAQAFGEAISVASNTAASLSAFKALPSVPGADDAFSIGTPPHPAAAAPLPPSPTGGEGIFEQETATEPCAHPGDQQGEVAAAGESSPLPDVPGHIDPAVRDTADEAGAPVVRAGVPASSLPALPGNSLGVELLGEIEAYLARTQMGGMMLGEFAVGHPGYVNLLRKRRTARPQTAFPLREFMERWPQGVTRDDFTAWGHARAAENAEAYRAASVAAAPGDAGFLADEIKAEALSAGERRHVARKFGGGVGNPLSANVVAVQAVLLAEPEDAFLFLRRKWPELLRQVIALARIEEATPATMLARVIEAGILSIADNLREEAA